MNKSATRGISLRFLALQTRHTYISLCSVGVVPRNLISFWQIWERAYHITRHQCHWALAGPGGSRPWLRARSVLIKPGCQWGGCKNLEPRAFSTSSTRVESTNFVLSPPLDNCFQVLSLCFALGHLRTNPHKRIWKSNGHTTPDWEEKCPPLRLKIFACRLFET